MGGGLFVLREQFTGFHLCLMKEKLTDNPHVRHIQN